MSLHGPAGVDTSQQGVVPPDDNWKLEVSGCLSKRHLEKLRQTNG